MRKSWIRMAGFCLLLILGLGSKAASAQTRMSDKDVENTLKNMQDDAKKFRSSFNSAVGKSTIRNTEQEKQAKALVEGFQKQTEGALKGFQSSKTSGAGLTQLRSSADQIDQLLATTPLEGDVTAQWSKVKVELTAISREFGLAPK